ncbi:MAG TPA: DUF5615 family PIN-like protein [Steroidobacteraceae bacterium]|nr:DUF5615 family PIN-like protein [Steroidobacteraceae bacterium]
MKLLFDRNLSFKLCALLSDRFPDSKLVRELGLDRSDDRVVWQHAKDNGFMFVSQDSDFAAESSDITARWAATHFRSYPHIVRMSWHTP